MRSRLHRALSRLALAALVGAAALAIGPQPSEAATIVYECRASSIGCISFSGYAGRSVWGYPVNSTGNNCTNYVAYRLARNGVAQQNGLGNGGSWAANARKRGFRVDTTPRAGAVAQWNYGSVYAPGYGHVGYVEEVTSTYITISDSSWSGGSYRWRIPKGDRNWPSSFIHFKDMPYQPPKPGAFVTVRETGEVYRLVGKAPVFVSTWTAFGGVSATHLLSSTSLASLPAIPADGTFIRGAQRGEVYRIAGGAPILVTSWTAMGGVQPYTTVDQTAIDKAGAGGRWNHLRARPQVAPSSRAPSAVSCTASRAAHRCTSHRSTRWAARTPTWWSTSSRSTGLVRPAPRAISRTSRSTGRTSAPRARGRSTGSAAVWPTSSRRGQRWAGPSRTSMWTRRHSTGQASRRR